MGTGTLVRIEGDIPLVGVLTVAHNILLVSSKGKQRIIDSYKEFKFYHQRCGIDKFVGELEGISGDYYHKYNNYFNSTDGYDFGIIWLNEFDSDNSYLMSKTTTIEDLNV